jgi:hypothetical protein
MFEKKKKKKISAVFSSIFSHQTLDPDWIRIRIHFEMIHNSGSSENFLYFRKLGYLACSIF